MGICCSLPSLNRKQHERSKAPTAEKRWKAQLSHKKSNHRSFKPPARPKAIVLPHEDRLEQTSIEISLPVKTDQEKPAEEIAVVVEIPEIPAILSETFKTKSSPPILAALQASSIGLEYIGQIHVYWLIQVFHIASPFC